MAKHDRNMMPNNFIQNVGGKGYHYAADIIIASMHPSGPDLERVHHSNLSFPNVKQSWVNQ